MILPPLFHWSPRERLGAIRRQGLVPGRPPTIGSIPAVHDEQLVVCFGTGPAAAWRLSGNMRWARHITCWDLWQTEAGPMDAVFVLPEWGNRIKEVRIGNRVPKSRLTWIGERSTRAAVPIR